MFCSKCGSTVNDGSEISGSFRIQASSKQLAKIAASMIAVIAMIVFALFTLSGCGGSNAGSSSAGSSSSSRVESAPMKSVEDYTWEELSDISAEISNETTEEDAIEVAKKYNLVNSNGKLDGTQTKTVQLSDGTTAVVQIVGFLHDDKTGGGKAGITFIFREAIAEHDMNPSQEYAGDLETRGTNVGGWKDSVMRSWLSSEVLSMLPTDLTNKIVAVDKKTNNVGETDDVASVTTTSDKIWLFSSIEVSGIDESRTAYEIRSLEGAEYRLFKDYNVKLNGTNDILIKSYDGSEDKWWLRSPDSGNNCYFYYVEADGRINMGESYGSHGVVPGFCI